MLKKITLLVVCVVLLSAVSAAAFDLTGAWRGNDGGRYYIRQLGSEIWWFGENSPTGPAWSNVARGTVMGNELRLEWADVPKGNIMNSGTLILNIVSSSKIVARQKSGGFGGSEWTREGAVTEQPKTGYDYTSQPRDYGKQNMGSGFEWDTDRMGSDYTDFNLPGANPQLCKNACEKDPKCKAWTYVKPNTIQGPTPRCWLKFAVPNPTRSNCCVSGVKETKAPTGWDYTSKPKTGRDYTSKPREDQPVNVFDVIKDIFGK